MKEIFEHEGNKYQLIEGNKDDISSCLGCFFRNEPNRSCNRWKNSTEGYYPFKEHDCADRTDIFVLMPTPGPKKKLKL